MKEYWILSFTGKFYDTKCRGEHEVKKLDFNLRYLKIGQRVGLCVTQSGDLHCYIDGIDKGTLYFMYWFTY